MNHRWQEIQGSAIYVVTHYVADHDIAAPIKVVVTTPASEPWHLSAEVFASATETLVVTEDVTIDVAGSALTFRRVNRQSDHPDADGPDVEQGGTYTGGTTIFSSVNAYKHDVSFVLKPSTSYLLTVTSKADNNRAALQVMVWRGP